MTAESIRKISPKLAKLIRAEEKRQQEVINLIPSENYASGAIRAAQGSVLTNKYSEGYPRKRYYPGNKIIDEIEIHTQELALRVFKLNPSVWHVNVQPYSGSPANLAVYTALMDFGETLLGMILSHGGHLTHGHPVSITGKAFRSVQYGLDCETERIDYQRLADLASKFRPKVIISGATAYPRIIDFQKFREIADKVGAYHMADIAHIAGLVAAGVHPSPFPYADVVTTTTHKTLRGPRGAVIFSRKDKFRSIAGVSRSISDLIDRAVFPGLQGGPHNHTTAAIGVAFAEALRPQFNKYQRQIVENAKVLAGELVKYGFRLVSGGTDNHLLLIDLKNKNIAGSEAERLLEAAGIIANRNSIHGDESPFRPSGIRIGAPAATTRGMKRREMRQIAQWIHEIIDKNGPPEEIRKRVLRLCRRFPVPV